MERMSGCCLGILLALGDDIQKVAGGEKLVHELVVVDQGEAGGGQHLHGGVDVEVVMLALDGEVLQALHDGR